MREIKRKVTHRLCPECGYMIGQLEIDMLRFAADCPRCGKHNTNSFQPIKWEASRNDNH